MPPAGVALSGAHNSSDRPAYQRERRRTIALASAKVIGYTTVRLSETILGYSAEELSSMSSIDQIHLDDLERVIEAALQSRL